MARLHDFLVEHAKFPFPHLDQNQETSISDLSHLEVGLLEADWKAKVAVRDGDLVQKLCRSLEVVLAGAPLSTQAGCNLLTRFSPQIQFRNNFEDVRWRENTNEVDSRTLLERGFFEAALTCLAIIIPERHFRAKQEHRVDLVGSRVVYCALLDNSPMVFCEAKSPAVMQETGDLLPLRGIRLSWVHHQPLMERILTKAALYLGRRKMQWLFLSCHNFWIVCRLVSDKRNPYLAYSPMISIKNSSEPFRAFLGAILSIFKGVPVDPSPYISDVELDNIMEEDDSPFPENAFDDNGEYRSSSGRGFAPIPQVTNSRARAAHVNIKSGLMITSSSPKSPRDFQVWVHLHTWSKNSFSLPSCAEGNQPRLWLTRFVASGSTGNVWECRFDNSDRLFAAKFVEVLRPSDMARRQRLRDEFDVYLTLDDAYRSGRLRNRIAPLCYGAFEGDGIDTLIFDICDDVVHDWDELSALEQSQIYQLVVDLHSVGIVHGDLEPRNIGRAHGGGFLLMDFSDSIKHVCKGIELGEAHTRPVSDKSQICPELRALRQLLRKWQPSKTNM